MKPRVAILFTGQVRSNQLNDTCENDTVILDSTSKFFINEEFKAKYDYDIFISTNTLDISAAKEYFGTNLKNVHLIERGYYLESIQTHIPEFEVFRNKLMSYNYEGKWVSSGNFWSVYRYLDACNLMENYMAQTGVKYDINVRCRLDTPFFQNLVPLFDEIIFNPSLHVITLHEMFTLGRPDIMRNYFRIIEGKYMLYRKGDTKYIFNSFMMPYTEYYTCDDGYFFCSEVQASEYFFEYCTNNNLDIQTALKSYPFYEYLHIYNRDRFT
jgi:hypothetical protein